MTIRRKCSICGATMEIGFPPTPSGIRFAWRNWRRWSRTHTMMSVHYPKET